MPRDYAQVLADARRDADVLKRHGEPRTADALLMLCANVEESVSYHLAWLSETEALARSAKSVDYFRARRDQWVLDGLAKKDGRRWFYRRCIVPRSRLSGLQRAEAAMERAG